MPRKNHKLTWQAGANGRAGRWRKKYKSRTYYFSGGHGKSDQEAYRQALAAWEAKKTDIDGQAPRPHEEAYVNAIKTWEQVSAWGRKHSDSVFAELAAEKLELLRRLIEAPKLRPLQDADIFEGQFRVPVIPLPEPHEIEPLSPDDAVRLREVMPKELTPTSIAKYSQELDGSSLRIEQEIWCDRLEVQARVAATPDESLQAHIDAFLQQKKSEADAGELSVNRRYKIELHLKHFAEWYGADMAVNDINGKTLQDYRLVLLKRVEKGDWSRPTASDHLVTLKSFVRWLWQVEAIPTLPRNLDSKSKALQISKPAAKIVVFTKDEIKILLDRASDRTKLYILLMLNCGMTQKDINDLDLTEVDWEKGVITRKRSKTADYENVPVVRYPLWEETLRLLLQERSSQKEGRVLTNANGGPLWHEELTEDGKYKKSDNVKSAFDRLRRKTGVKKSLKCLKKTSASLICGNARYSSLESLFLGHTPQRMSERHYAKAPEELLAEAIEWLAEEYTIVNLRL